jgi:hypothetical protein
MANQSKGYCITTNNSNAIQLVVVGSVMVDTITTKHQQTNTYLNNVQHRLAQSISGGVT